MHFEHELFDNTFWCFQTKNLTKHLSLLQGTELLLIRAIFFFLNNQICACVRVCVCVRARVCDNLHVRKRKRNKNFYL